MLYFVQQQERRDTNKPQTADEVERVIPMIKVQIKETGAIETLKVVGANGQDFTADMIGNHEGFGSADHQFAGPDDYGLYTASQETFDWWEKVLADTEALEERLESLREEHGSEAVQEVIDANGSVDLEDFAASLNRELDDAFSGK